VCQRGRMDPTPLSPPTDTVEFVCPRCSASVDERLYGPCETCRAQLRASMGNEQREVAVADYEPKMNVTPNAVASKD
jgi:hypothetical protein